MPYLTVTQCSMASGLINNVGKNPYRLILLPEWQRIRVFPARLLVLHLRFQKEVPAAAGNHSRAVIPVRKVRFYKTFTRVKWNLTWYLKMFVTFNLSSFDWAIAILPLSTSCLKSAHAFVDCDICDIFKPIGKCGLSAFDLSRLVQTLMTWDGWVNFIKTLFIVEELKNRERLCKPCFGNI